MEYQKIIMIVFLISLILSFYRMGLENLWDDGYWQYTKKIKSLMLNGEDITNFMQEYKQSNRVLFPFVSALLSLIVINVKFAVILVSIICSYFLLRTQKLFYKLKSISKKENYYTILMFFSASTTIANISRPRTDMMGILFVVLSIFFISKYMKTNDEKYKVFMCLSITAAIMTREVFWPLILIAFLTLRKLKFRDIFLFIVPIIIFVSFLFFSNTFESFMNHGKSTFVEGGAYYEFRKYNTPQNIIKWIIYMFSITPLIILYDLTKNYKRRLIWVKNNLKNPYILWVLFYFTLILLIPNALLEDKILWLPIAPFIYMYISKIIVNIEKENKYGKYLIFIIIILGYLIFLTETGWKIYFDNLWSSERVFLNLSTKFTHF